jgi:predicted RNase H-like HicB family nuclease
MFEFPAIVFESPFGWFVIEFPDLPDCVVFAKSPSAAPAAAAGL